MSHTRTADDQLFQPTTMYGVWPLSAGDTDPPQYLFRHKEDAEEFLAGFAEELPGQYQVLPCTVQGVRRQPS